MTDPRKNAFFNFKETRQFNSDIHVEGLPPIKSGGNLQNIKKRKDQYRVACIVANRFEHRLVLVSLDSLHGLPVDFDVDLDPTENHYSWGRFAGQDIVISSPPDGPRARTFSGTVRAMLAPFPRTCLFLVAQANLDSVDQPVERSETRLHSKMLPQLRLSVTFSQLKAKILHQRLQPQSKLNTFTALSELQSSLEILEGIARSGTPWAPGTHEESLLESLSLPVVRSLEDPLDWSPSDAAQIDQLTAGILAASRKESALDFAVLAIEVAHLALSSTRGGNANSSLYQVRN